MAKRPTAVMSFVARTASTRGPRVAADWRNSNREIATDFTTLQNLWNTYITPLLSLLPDGTGTATQKVDDFGTSLNAFSAGLDGSQLYTDADVLSTEPSGLFWNTTRDRPYTIKEQIQYLSDLVASTSATLQQSIADASFGLSASEKAAIGDRIFGGVSTPTSLDGMVSTNSDELTALQRDIYDDATQLSGSGKTLTNSISVIVDALLALHNHTGDWDKNLGTLSHAGIWDTLPQTDGGDGKYVLASGGGLDDTVLAGGVNLLGDLNFIRSIIRQLKGTAGAGTWTDALNPGNVLKKTDDTDATTLAHLFDGDVKGQGTQTNTNPWGYRLDDLDEGVISFTGMSAYDDSSPTYSTYSALNVIADGQPLEQAVALVDSGNIVHRQYPYAVDPSAGLQHYADAIAVAPSGVYTASGNQPYPNLQDNLDWMCDPSDFGGEGQNTFRRMQLSILDLPDQGTLQIAHNRGAWPTTQFFEYDGFRTGAPYYLDIVRIGLIAFQVDNDTIAFFNDTGHDIVSGEAILLW